MFYGFFMITSILIYAYGFNPTSQVHFIGFCVFMWFASVVNGCIEKNIRTSKEIAKLALKELAYGIMILFIVFQAAKLWL